MKVAVIDSGVYFAHPDLAGVLDTTHDYDFVNKDSDASDDNGHGTHVTGLVAAIANNKTRCRESRGVWLRRHRAECRSYPSRFSTRTERAGTRT